MDERLELYRIVVDSITTNEARRQQVMNINITLMIGGLAAIGGIETLDPLFMVVPGLLLSVIWLGSVRYFRALAQAKFSVISTLEEGFEIKPYALEWKNMKKVTFNLTHLEMFVPTLVIVICIAYLILRSPVISFVL